MVDMKLAVAVLAQLMSTIITIEGDRGVERIFADAIRSTDWNLSSVE